MVSMASTNENNDMILLVNATSEEGGQAHNVQTIEQTMPDQCLQLASPFETQQYILQSNSTVIPEELQSIGDFLRNQSITLDGGELSVLEKDGLQYIVLTSVSVSHLLQDNNILITQQADINTSTSETYSASDLIVAHSVDNVQLQSLHSGLSPDNEIQPQLNQANIATLQSQDTYSAQIPETLSIPTQPVTSFSQINHIPASGSDDNQPTSAQLPEPTSTSLESVQLQSFEPQFTTSTYTPDLDFSKIVPTLCENGVLPGNRSQEPVRPHCMLCSFTAATELELDDHMNAHRNEMTTLLYKNCKENFEKRQTKGKTRKKKSRSCKYIRTTVPQLPKKGPFTCSVCNLEIPKINLFRKHLKDHINEKPFKCDQCSETYNLENNLILHKGLHAEKGENGYSCPSCQRTFMRVASLKSHIALHFEDETMICTECGDEFMLKSELDTHMIQHQQDVQQHLLDRSVPVSNSQAQSVLTNTITLSSKALQDIIVSERNFRMLKSKKRSRRRADPQQCHVCQKIFQKESQFKRHMLIHTGEKPFMCNHCGRSFNQKSALQVHMFKHSGQKPHKCPYCPQLYAQLGNLRMHVERVHSYGTNKFKCTACSCIFKRMGSLNAHITKYHQNDNATKDMSTSEELMSLITEDPTSVSIPSSVQPTSDDPPLQSTASSTSVTSDLPSHTSVVRNKSGKEDLDVIQQLLRSLDDDENNTNSMNVTTEDGALLDSVIDNDIVHRAFMDSGLENENSSKKDSSKDGDLDENDKEKDSNPLGFTEEELGVEDNLHSAQPRSSVISGLYMRTIGPSGEHTWKVRKSNGIRWHQCMYCQKEFKKPSDLVRHIRVHTQERPYKCSTCHKSFSVKTSLTTHARTHLGYKAFKCQICLKSFSTPGSLKIHLRVHTGSRPFKCTQCELSFRTASHRHNHILSHMRGTAHKRLRKPRKDIAQLILTAPQVTLQEPISISSNINNVGNNKVVKPVEEAAAEHKCLICSKGFKKSSHLRQHIRTHTGEKPYQCNQCGLSVASASNLKTHMCVHTGLKAHQCTVCGQYFGSNNTLKRHMTTHSDARPYMCPYCQKTFKTNATCKKHIATHKNDIVEQQSSQDLVADHDSNSTNTIDQQTLIELQSIQAQQEQYASQSSGMLTHDGISLNHQTIEINNDPVLEQIDPNIIQDFGRMATYKVNQNQEESTADSYVTNNLDASFENCENDTYCNSDANTGNSYCENPEQNYLVRNTEVPSSEMDNGNTTSVAQHINTFHGNIENGMYELNVEKTGNTGEFGTKSSTQSDENHENNISMETTNNNSETQEQDESNTDENRDEAMLKCLGCAKAFESRAELTVHQTTEQSQALPFQCSLCCHSLESRISLASHTEAHNLSNVVSCPVCFISFDSRGVPDEHRIFHNPNEFKCKVCGKVFQSESVLQIHNVSHNYKSTVKQKRKRTAKFYVLSEEQNEILKNTDPNQSMTLSERVLISAVADKDTVSFVQKESGRGRHKEFELNGPLHSNVCQYCPKSFQKPSDLARHIRIHTGDKPYKCSQCGKSFTLKSTMVVHERAHLHNKMFRCHICDMMYASKASLKVHMRLHTGAKPYKCSVCPMTFRASSHRKSHMATHMVMRTKAKDSLQTKTNTGETKPSTPTSPSTQPSSPKQGNSSNVVWPDMTLTVPMETLLAGNLFQNESEGIPISVNEPDIQLHQDQNISLQIDPIIEQSVSNGNIHASKMLNQTTDEQTQNNSNSVMVVSSFNSTPSDSTFVTSGPLYPQTNPTWPPPNVVIQPISNLCYQPMQNVSDPKTPLSDMNRQQFQEINIAVPSNLAGVTQQLLQSPLVVTLNNDGTGDKNQEFTVNLNNPAVIQAVQQALSNLASSRIQGQVGNLNNSDITLTINPQDLQVVTNEVTISNEIGQPTPSSDS